MKNKDVSLCSSKFWDTLNKTTFELKPMLVIYNKFIFILIIKRENKNFINSVNSFNILYYQTIANNIKMLQSELNCTPLKNIIFSFKRDVYIFFNYLQKINLLSFTIIIKIYQK